MAVLVKKITAHQLLTGLYTDGSTILRPNVEKSATWLHGGGVNEAQQYYELTATASGSGAFFDFSGGSETDIFGATLALVNVHGFALFNTTRTTGLGITLTGDFITTVFSTATSWTVPPGGKLEWYSPIGKDITAGGNTLSYIRSGGTNANFTLYLIGTTVEE